MISSPKSKGTHGTKMEPRATNSRDLIKPFNSMSGRSSELTAALGLTSLGHSPPPQLREDANMLPSKLSHVNSQGLNPTGGMLSAADLPARLPGTEKSFPHILYEIVSDPKTDDIVAWLPHGKGFYIHDKTRFAVEMLPLFGEVDTKFTSFTRRLKRWEFLRIPSGAERGAYYHDNFVRGKMDAVLSMTYPGLHRQFDKVPKVTKDDIKSKIEQIHNAPKPKAHVDGLLFARGAAPTARRELPDDVPRPMQSSSFSPPINPVPRCLPEQGPVRHMSPTHLKPTLHAKPLPASSMSSSKVALITPDMSKDIYEDMQRGSSPRNERPLDTKERLHSGPPPPPYLSKSPAEVPSGPRNDRIPRFECPPVATSPPMSMDEMRQRVLMEKSLQSRGMPDMRMDSRTIPADMLEELETMKRMRESMVSRFMASGAHAGQPLRDLDERVLPRNPRMEEELFPMDCPPSMALREDPLATIAAQRRKQELMEAELALLRREREIFFAEMAVNREREIMRAREQDIIMAEMMARREQARAMAEMRARREPSGMSGTRPEP